MIQHKIADCLPPTRALTHSLALRLFCGAMLAVTAPAHAQTYSPAQTACRTWTDLRASSRAAPEMSWLQGYMISAFDNNAVLSGHKHAYSDQNLYSAIDEYCSASPGQQLVTAVRALEANLIKRWSQTQ